MSSKTKFYAVRVGRTPGVYLTWKECQAQVNGFKSAVYKGFTTLSDAEAFVAGLSIKDGTQKKYQAVARGVRPGIYTDWGTAQQGIGEGTKGTKFKSFTSMGDAQSFMDSWEDVPVSREHVKDEAEVNDDELEGWAIDLEVEKNKKRILKVEKAAAIPEAADTSGAMIIYTDGSSLANGRTDARAGVGIYFGPDDPRNISERLPGLPQTNQRAELNAILRTLETLPTSASVQIKTDSKYAISCVTEWCSNWERNGWRNCKGGNVQNKDLVQAILLRIRARDKAGASTHFEWVQGHGTSAGNIAANELAMAGARRP